MDSGTTGVVAKRLNRNFIGIEIDDVYFELAKKRIEITQPEVNLVKFLQKMENNAKSQLKFYSQK